ncbi:MAG: membrane protein insertion efficiency factor YidD [Planctomycetes bacterium]|nr:membrane protein insertion efficiency factor YidD [Planctomycetota bacterium]
MTETKPPPTPAVGRFPGLRRRKHLYLALLVVVLAWACAKPAAVLAIGGYQQYISPNKGYRCAHATHYGGLSCSQYGKQAIQTHGVLGGLMLLWQRFDDCHDAAVALRAERCQPLRPQAGDDCAGCFETPEEQGRREGQETKQYCAGCAQGCCSSD